MYLKEVIKIIESRREIKCNDNNDGAADFNNDEFKNTDNYYTKNFLDEGYRKEKRLLRSKNYLDDYERESCSQSPLTHCIDDAIRVIGLLIGFLSIVSGIVLTLLDITGSINWNFSFGPISSSLSTGTVGVLLIISGFTIIVMIVHSATKK